MLLLCYMAYRKNGTINRLCLWLGVMSILTRRIIAGYTLSIITSFKFRKLHESDESAAYHSVGREPYVIEAALSMSAVGAT